jgi:malonate transporter
MIPVTVVMLEYEKRRSTQGETCGLAAVVGQAVIDSLKRPLVWAPLLATILVLMGVPVPRAFESMLDQIGSATAGVGLFASGLIIATCHAKVTAESLGNSFLKMVVQPVLMGLLVPMLGVAKPLGSRGIVMCALPTAAVPVMLALNYHVYENEAASVLLLTTLIMIVTTPIAIAWAAV